MEELFLCFGTFVIGFLLGAYIMDRPTKNGYEPRY